MKLALLLFLTQLALAQPASLPDTIVPTLLDSAGIPGLSVAVINQRGVVWSNGFGVRKAGEPKRVDQQTVFSAASLSKPVFAYLVLKLVDAGKLDLDKPLYQYVPYRAIEHDERYKRITARLVLSHQTGFPNWRTGQLNLLFDPGRRFSYSGEGFVYLQGVVMTITGQEIDELAQQYVFGPLGMSRSSYRWQPAFEDNHATAHNRFGAPTPSPRFDQANVAYSLQTTAADYGRFLVALLNGEGLKPATAQALFSQQTPVGQTLHDTTKRSTALGWGLGVGLLHQAGNDGFWHWGDNGDFRCFAYVSRTRRQGLVYFTNSRNGLSLMSVLPHRLLGLSTPAITDFLQYDSYQSPPVQVSRRLLKNGVTASVLPFLQTKSSNARLAEEDLTDIAEELSNGPHINQAVDLLILGSRYYPQSANLLRVYAYACLKQGDDARARTLLNRYVVLKPGDESARHILSQLIKPPTGNVTFRLPGLPNAHLITLAGSFNDWQPLHTIFRKEGTEWRCTLQLPKGKYTYKIRVDDQWQTDPTNPNTEDDGHGNINSVLTVE